MVCHLAAMAWGSVELEAEVAEWVKALPAAEFGRTEFYIDLLAERGPLLDQPYTRQLRGKLRELRFYLGPRGDAVRCPTSSPQDVGLFC